MALNIESLMNEMEDALEARWEGVMGEPMPTEGRDQLLLLLGAVAEGVVNHFKAAAEVKTEDVTHAVSCAVTVNAGSTTHSHPASCSETITPTVHSHDGRIE